MQPILNIDEDEVTKEVNEEGANFQHILMEEWLHGMLAAILIGCILLLIAASKQARDYQLLPYVQLELEKLDKHFCIPITVNSVAKALPEGWEEGMHPDGR